VIFDFSDQKSTVPEMGSIANCVGGQPECVPFSREAGAKI